MKLLLDQNISFRVVAMLAEHFPGSEQVKRLGLSDKTDREIWDFARLNGFTIVTFDSDFYDLSVTFGSPPKLIWVHTGNQTRNNLTALLQNKVQEILSFLQDPEINCLELL